MLQKIYIATVPTNCGDLKEMQFHAKYFHTESAVQKYLTDMMVIKNTWLTLAFTIPYIVIIWLH